MKRIALLLSLFVICLSLVGCKSTATEYDDKEILRIETKVSDSWDSVKNNRVFDFKTGSVTDEYELDEYSLESRRKYYAESPERFPEYANAEAYDEYLNNYYNNPKQISTFDDTKVETFMKKIISNNFYTWESYDYSVMDGTDWYIGIYFSDGTVKAMNFYGIKPAWLFSSSDLKKFFAGYIPKSNKLDECKDKVRNYKKVNSAFQKYFGAEIFMLTDFERQ